MTAHWDCCLRLVGLSGPGLDLKPQVCLSKIMMMMGRASHLDALQNLNFMSIVGAVQIIRLLLWLHEAMYWA